MRLIVGPAGSGKTSLVLNELRDALRGGRAAVRLLVPTATLAQHLQNQLAREGCALRGGAIQTLSSFVRPWALPVVQAPDSVVYLAVEEAVRRIDRAEFRQVAHLAGFCGALARTLAEFSSAGCDSQRLRQRLPDTPLAAPFLAIYKEVEAALERRGLALRARCLQLAAARIAAEGLAAFAPFGWMDFTRCRIRSWKCWPRSAAMPKSSSRSIPPPRRNYAPACPHGFCGTAHAARPFHSRRGRGARR
jgi:hypothetical protein